VNVVQFSPKEIVMQTLVVKYTGPTFLDDVRALVAAAVAVYGVLSEIVTAPLDRIARASDVAGVLPPARRTRRRAFSFGSPSFRNLNHLT
jgi:hypothetical protein